MILDENRARLYWQIFKIGQQSKPPAWRLARCFQALPFGKAPVATRGFCFWLTP